MVKNVYDLTQSFPKEEEYGLKSQLRRAAVSVPSNLAEGLTRMSKKERLRFLNIADASLSEIDTQLEIAQLLGYIDQGRFEECETLVVRVEQLVGGLRRSLLKRAAPSIHD
jgi:four helix bundle protein